MIKIENPEISSQLEILSNAFQNVFERKNEDNIIITSNACTKLIKEGEHQIIYDCIKQVLQNHFKEFYSQLINSNGDPLLTFLSDEYKQLQIYCTLFPQFCSSFDEYYLREKKELNKTINMIKLSFIQNVLSKTTFFNELITPSIITVIQNAQKNFDIDLEDVKNIISIFYSFTDETQDTFDYFIQKLKEKEQIFYDLFFTINFRTISQISDYISIANKQCKTDISIFKYIFHSKKEINAFIELSKNSLYVNHIKSYITEIYEFNSKENTYMEFINFFKALINHIRLPDTFYYNITQIGQIIDLLYNFIDLFEIVFNEKLEKFYEVVSDSLYNIHSNFLNKLFVFLEQSEINDKLRYDRLFDLYKLTIKKDKFEFFFESFFINTLIKRRSKAIKAFSPVIEKVRTIDSNFLPFFEAYVKQFNESVEIKKDFNNNNYEDTHMFNPIVFNKPLYPLSYEDGIDSYIPKKFKDVNSKFKRSFIDRNQYAELVNCVFEFSYETKYKIIINDIYTAQIVMLLADGPHKRSEIYELFDYRIDDRFDESLADDVSNFLNIAIINLLNLKLIKIDMDMQRPSYCDVLNLNDEFHSSDSTINISPVFDTLTLESFPAFYNEKNADLPLIDPDVFNSIEQEIMLLSRAEGYMELSKFESKVLENCRKKIDEKINNKMIRKKLLQMNRKKIKIFENRCNSEKYVQLLL